MRGFGGVENILKALPEGKAWFDPVEGIGSAILAAWMAVMITMACSTQAAVQIALSARDERSARNGFLLGAFGGKKLGKVETKHEKKTYSFEQSEIDEIVGARYEEIFEAVAKELKKAGRAGNLPSGAVLTGGGANTKGLVDFTKEQLGVAARLGFVSEQRMWNHSGFRVDMGKHPIIVLYMHSF